MLSSSITNSLQYSVSGLNLFGGNRLPSDITSLIHNSTSKVGPDLIHSAVAGYVPDQDGGVQDSQIPPVKDGWYLASPAYSNLFTGAPTEAETKTLTVQKYCLQCVGGSVAAGVYGTATPSTPLIFTALAGDQAFTPIDCTAWMLSAADGYPFDIIPPGASVVSTISTVGGNGLSVALTGGAKEEALAASFGASGTTGILVRHMVSSTALPADISINIATCNPATAYFYKFSKISGTPYVEGGGGGGYPYFVKGYEASDAVYCVMEWGGGKVRVGYQQVGVDAVISWSHATLAAGESYNGSFPAGEFLQLFRDNTVPIKFRGMWVSKLSGLGDAVIIDRKWLLLSLQGYLDEINYIDGDFYL